MIDLRYIPFVLDKSMQAETAPFQFGLYSDKFGKFLVELCAEFGQCGQNVPNYTSISKFNIISRSKRVMFVNAYASYKINGIKYNYESRVFKNQFGEICMIRNINVASIKVIKVVDNEAFVKSVASIIKRLCFFCAHKNKIDKLAKSLKYKEDYQGVLTASLRYNDNNYIVEKFDDGTFNYFLVDKQSKLPDYNKPFSIMHPSNYDMKDKSCWNSKSTDKFMHTSFTCRDAYLVYLLLTGASDSKIRRNGYSLEEANEWRGTPKSVLEAEILLSKQQQIIDAAIDITVKYHNEVNAYITEASKRNVLPESFKKLGQDKQIEKIREKYIDQFYDIVNGTILDPNDENDRQMMSVDIVCQFVGFKSKI